MMSQLLQHFGRHSPASDPLMLRGSRGWLTVCHRGLPTILNLGNTMHRIWNKWHLVPNNLAPILFRFEASVRSVFIIVDQPRNIFHVRIDSILRPAGLTWWDKALEDGCRQASNIPDLNGRRTTETTRTTIVIPIIPDMKRNAVS